MIDAMVNAAKWMHNDGVTAYTQSFTRHHGDEGGRRGGNVDPPLIGLTSILDQ
jgi:hypothetical protein